MKSKCCLVSAMLLLSSGASGADFSTNGTTLFRFQQRDMRSTTKSYAPLMQFVQMDAYGTGGERLSMHVSGWGRADLADESTNGGKSGGNLDYGYMQYSHPTGNSTFRLGRMLTLENGYLEQFDGVSLSSDLLQKYKGLSLAIFLGKPVSQYKGESVRGDYLYGGRLSYRYEGVMEIGGYFSQENGMLRTAESTDIKDYRRWMGADFWLKPSADFTIEGKSLYDGAGKGFAENRGKVTWDTSKNLTVAAQLRQNDYKALFSSTNLRTLFNPDNTEKATAFGGVAIYRFDSPFQISFDVESIKRDNRGGGMKVGGELQWIPSATVTTGFAIHNVTSGELQKGIEGFTPPDYNQLRCFGLYRKDSLSAGADLSAQIYSDSVNGKKSGYELTVTGGYQLNPLLKLSADISAAGNPEVDSEMRIVARLSYNYEKGAGK